MQPQPNHAISGHLRLREGKRGATWYAKYRGPVRLHDGRIAIKQTETRIGPAWTGTGRTPAGTYTRRTAQAWLDAKLTDLRRGIGITAVGDSATFADAAAEWYRHGCHEGAWKPSTRRDYRSALSAHLGVDLDPETGAVVAARAPFGDSDRCGRIEVRRADRPKAHRRLRRLVRPEVIHDLRRDRACSPQVRFISSLTSSPMSSTRSGVAATTDQ